MSNTNIVSRLNSLADEFERDEVSVAVLASQLIGHAEALDRMEYQRIKEAHLVQGQLLRAIEERREHDVDRATLLSWLRDWIKKVPVNAD